MIGIYKITSPKGKIYIGQSTNIQKRLSSYRRLECKQQIRLYRSFVKYGFEHHTIKVIVKCSTKRLNEIERLMQDKHSSVGPMGLNCQLTETGSLQGRHSEESKRKMSISRIGNKNNLGNTHSEETKLKISASKKGKSYNFGRPVSEETREKMRISKLGKSKTEEHRMNVAKSLIGNKRALGLTHSEETRKKISEKVLANNKLKKL